MDKKVKDKWIGARVDGPYEKRVGDYIAGSKELTLAQLIRLSLDEYMLNHPVKDTKLGTPEHLNIKPGE
jgi:hypothetical protein